MDYKFDVFLSYTHGFIEEWVQKHFLPLFGWHLLDPLGRDPIVFIDREGLLSGDSWPLPLKRALAYSRCLISIWSPSYFKSVWCMREFHAMLHRERQVGYRTVEQPCGLVLPVNLSDGKHFPAFAKNIQYLDCRDYALKFLTRDLPIYYNFELQVKSWVKEVAFAIRHAPRWRKEWLDEPVIKIPETTSFTFDELPGLE